MGKSKKELDRDMMFRKIMPALADNPFSSLVAEPEPAPKLPVQEMVNLAATAQASPFVSQPEALDVQVHKLDTLPESDLPSLAVLSEPTPISAPMQPIESRSMSRRQVEYPLPPSDDFPEDDLSILRARLFGRSNISSDTVSTINLMENLVLQHLDEVIQRFNCCRCDRCRRDIAAFALNQLPAQYIVAEPVTMDSIEPRISKKDVYNSLVKAVLQVRTHPRH